MPPSEGIYLIQTISTARHPFKHPRFIEAKVTLGVDEKGSPTYAIDMNNQQALAISTKPIR